MAVQPSHYRYWHTTGTVGTFGAAAATALLLGCDAERTAHAIATAATFAGGLQQAFRGDGMSKPLHPGHAAEAGALAAIGAAASGVTGALDVLHGPVGFAAATSEDTGKWDKALAGLDERFAITAMTFKNHGCCGHIFPALDAVRPLRERARLRPRGGGAHPPRRLRRHQGDLRPPGRAPEQEARFSAQYCIATLVHHGAVRLAAFAPERLADPALRAFMPKVSVSLDPDLADAYPGRRAARIRLELNDGRVFDHRATDAQGRPRSTADGCGAGRQVQRARGSGARGGRSRCAVAGRPAWDIIAGRGGPECRSARNPDLTSQT